MRKTRGLFWCRKAVFEGLDVFTFPNSLVQFGRFFDPFGFKHFAFGAANHVFSGFSEYFLARLLTKVYLRSRFLRLIIKGKPFNTSELSSR